MLVLLAEQGLKYSIFHPALASKTHQKLSHTTPTLNNTYMLHTTDYKHFRVVKADGAEFSFEGASSAKPALPGDTVEMKAGIVTSVTKRAKHPNLVGTLELASKFRFGMTSRNVLIFRFVPFNESYPPFFVGCSQTDMSKNMLALIEFSNWDAGTCPRGNLVRMFGACGDLVAEEEALLAHACLTSWKRDETTQLQPPAGCPGQHITIGNTFHIDPPGCRDIDDAITLRQIDSGIVEVKIHIADVASWLATNPQLHTKAAEIGQTYYRDGVAVKPMFPVNLSEGLFSLLPGQERSTWTLTLFWNTATAAPVSDCCTWTSEKIVVRESYTYVTIYESPHAALLRQITSGLAGRDLTDSHEWVEQLMLLYNREVAQTLRATGTGILRRHAGKDLARYEALAALGLPADKLAMHGGEYCLATDADTKHWGLQVDAYCHASSPIRRWADCINQMILRKKVLSGIVFTKESLAEQVAALNEKGKRAKTFERDLLFVRVLLRGHTDIPLEGVVAEMHLTKTKLWVPTWGRMVTSRQTVTNCSPGDRVAITYYADPTQRAWKRRIVIQFQTLTKIDAQPPTQPQLSNAT